jgi:hypothetical protein
VLSGGTASGITGVHVTTNESFAGEPVKADAAGMQSLLDASRGSHCSGVSRSRS